MGKGGTGGLEGSYTTGYNFSVLFGRLVSGEMGEADLVKFLNIPFDAPPSPHPQSFLLPSFLLPPSSGALWLFGCAACSCGFTVAYWPITSDHILSVIRYLVTTRLRNLCAHPTTFLTYPLIAPGRTWRPWAPPNRPSALPGAPGRTWSHLVASYHIFFTPQALSLQIVGLGLDKHLNIMKSK